MKRSRWSIDESPAASTDGPASTLTSKIASTVASECCNPSSNKSLLSLPPPCPPVDAYTRLSHIDSGTFGDVWLCSQPSTATRYALKQVKVNAEALVNGMPLSALREVNALLTFDHPHIVKAYEMLSSPVGSAFLRMELCPRDVRAAVESLPDVMTVGEVKQIMHELSSALAHVHGRGYMHRDLKTSNVLVGCDGGIRLCDFGCARRVREPRRRGTVPVVSLWYRPPELLMGEDVYGAEVDIWSLGCVFGELLNLTPMWEGRGEVDQLAKVFAVLGRPTEEVWPGWEALPHARTLKFKGPKKSNLRGVFPSNVFSGKTFLDEAGFELMEGMLSMDPRRRVGMKEVMASRYFTSGVEMKKVEWGVLLN